MPYLQLSPLARKRPRIGGILLRSLLAVVQEDRSPQGDTGILTTTGCADKLIASPLYLPNLLTRAW